MHNEIAELEIIIETLDTLYEEGSDCIHPFTNKIVSDAEYDELRKKLSKLYPESKILKTPTASKLNTITKIRHNPPFTSISKAIGTLQERDDTLKKFQNDIIAELNYKDPVEKWLVQAYKHDGVAVALYYEDGKLTKAGLRPRNGFDGEDVTVNIKMVEGIQTELWEYKDDKKSKFLPVNCCIRGELECKKSVFEEIVKDWENPIYDLDNKPKNPRNYTAGSIRQFSNPKITEKRRLSFTGYSIIGWSTKDNQVIPFKTEIERAKYANSVLRIPFVQVRPFRYQDLKVLEDLQNKLDYEVDGIVLSVNNLEDSEQMGNSGGSATGNPKSKLAWKFSEQSVITTVKDIEWTTGRTGALTPVLLIEPVILDGTTVSAVTGHSLGFLNGSSKSSLGELSKGAEIRIIKSGKIIPKVIEIVKNGSKLNIPSICPSCKKDTEIVVGGDGTELVCNNEFCGTKAVANFVHYLSTFGVKGVAESTLTKMYENEVIEDICDLYEFTPTKLINIGFTERQALLTVARIRMCPNPTNMEDDELSKWIADHFSKKIKIPAGQFFACLGINGAGKTSGQNLINHFGSFEAIMDATEDELLSVSDVGETTAKSIYDYFVKNRSMIKSLLLYYIEPESPKIGKFTGYTFVFTGGFPGGKQTWEKKVQDAGGKIGSSVSKTTSYVVVGTDAGSKAEKADKLGIKKLSLNDLEKML